LDFNFLTDSEIAESGSGANRLFGVLQIFDLEVGVRSLLKGEANNLLFGVQDLSGELFLKSLEDFPPGDQIASVSGTSSIPNRMETLLRREGLSIVAGVVANGVETVSGLETAFRFSGVAAVLISLSGLFFLFRDPELLTGASTTGVFGDADLTGVLSFEDKTTF
jgi:hypothetical protein